MKEVWKTISNHPNYQISSHGRVRSLNRIVSSPQGPRKLKGKVLSPGTSSKGYLQVSLCSNGKKSTAKIHLLVAEEFIRKADANESVHHIDFNKINNRLDNLTVMNHQEHMKLHGLT